MANRRLPMRKIKEILRLHFQARLSARQIARSCSVSRATVGDYLSRTRAAQLDWKQVCQMSEAELEGQLFPPPAPRGRHRPPPDLAYVHRELRGKSVTLQLLWQEYKQVHPDGYQYSQFCDLYNRWRGKLDVVLRQNHRAGEKMFVDYAGQTVELVDPKTGEMRQTGHLRGRAGSQQLHLRRGYGEPESSVLDRRSCAGRGVLRWNYPGGDPGQHPHGCLSGMLLRAPDQPPALPSGRPITQWQSSRPGCGLPGTRGKSNRPF